MKNSYFFSYLFESVRVIGSQETAYKRPIDFIIYQFVFVIKLFESFRVIGTGSKHLSYCPC
jgi:hypothetical protein